MGCSEWFSPTQFIAEVFKRLCRCIGADNIYSSPYHPQGNSICESFMRRLNKALASSIVEDGHDCDSHLQAVAFAHNSTPHTSTDHSPYFLVQGREAVLPVQLCWDAPPLELPSKRWLERLWAAIVQLYQEHMKAANEGKRLLKEPGAILPRRTVNAMKLTPAELQGISRKLAPRASADSAGGTLPRWIAPDERRPNKRSSTRDNQSLAASPDETLTVTQPQEHEQLCRQAPPPPDEVTEPALVAEPLREGLRWTLSRRATAAPGELFVRACREYQSEPGCGWFRELDLGIRIGHSTWGR
ncbi:hypothetical protein Efla_001934 [Eimeria flavescens]